MKIGTLAAAGLLSASLATTASAAVISGLSDVTNNGGGSWTFVFDSVGSDINGTGDGLSFTNGMGLSFLATGTNGGAPAQMIQDHPTHGGLGVDFGPSGDNLGVGEEILLSFNQAVDIQGWTLNGGHKDAATGDFTMKTNLLLFGFLAAEWDGVGSENLVQGSFCSSTLFGCGTSAMKFGSADFVGSTGFTGYLESITVQVSAVPIPAGGLLLLSGLGGLAALRRRRKS